MSEQETFFRSILIMPSEFFNSKDEKQNSVKKKQQQINLHCRYEKVVINSKCP